MEPSDDSPTKTKALQRKRIVIVGGGFGGLAAARGLVGAPVEITLIDRRNYHLFQPLLYQVATAALSPADIAQPIRRILRRYRNVQVVLGSVTGVDLKENLVHWDKGTIHYDYLIVAAGVTHAYFGHEEWSQEAPGLKTVEDALEIRRRLLLAFESAEIEDDANARRASLTFVIVGGGPTGVELAGSLREIAVESMQRDFRRVDTTTARVVLVEAQSRLLPSMSEKASARAMQDLLQMGVEVRLCSRLTELVGDNVTLERDDKRETIQARNVIWAAGIQAESLAAELGAPLDRSGRVIVQEDCSILGFTNAFVVGDMATLLDPVSKEPVPGVAQGALQMGAFVANLIDKELRGDQSQRPTFRYRDKGSLATIGRGKAVADIGGHSYGGFVAWIVWAIVHIAFLVGFRNRTFVMTAWAWKYLARVEGARLITGEGTSKGEQARPKQVP